MPKANPPHVSLPARIYGAYCWAIFIAVALVFGTLIMLWPGSRTQCRRITRMAVRLMFRLAAMPLDVDGLERLPSAPHILLVNHTSFLDGLVLTAALPASPGYAFVVRQQYRSQVLFWPLLRALGAVLIRRHDDHAAPSNTDTLLAAIRNGGNLIIFPEGRINRTAGVRPFHSGAFVVAARAGVPVVIAGINGARKALPLKTWRPVRGRILLKIGAVLEPQAAGSAAMQTYARVARDRMIPLTGEKAVGN